jgi:hypothetical protein
MPPWEAFSQIAVRSMAASAFSLSAPASVGKVLEVCHPAPVPGACRDMFVSLLFRLYRIGGWMLKLCDKEEGW